MSTDLSGGLFGALPETAARPSGAEGRARLREPRRDEIFLQAVDLDSAIGRDHPVRLYWDYVCRLDLRALENAIKSREGRAGHPAVAPKLMMALWLCATSEGVGSARALEDLCNNHDAYRWLCGGVSVNYHTLSDFRTAHGALLDKLLTENVAALAAAGVIDLRALAHDGMRVRAAAGASSFRRKATVREHLRQAREVVEALKREQCEAPEASRTRMQAARERAARERAERLDAALAKHDEIAKSSKPAGGWQSRRERKVSPTEAKEERDEDGSDGGAPPDASATPLAETDVPASKKPKEPRVSTTDPQARVIKMPDGGFRPAYNMQITTAAGTLIVVGVDAATNSSDRGLLKPALEQADARFGAMPTECLADGGFNKNEDIEWAASAGIAVFCPPLRNKYATDPFAPREDDGPGIAQWRKRMSSEAGKQRYGERSLTECVHARMRDCDLYQLTVRGVEKARTILTWQALAHNIKEGHRLLTQSPGRNLALAAAS